MGKNVIISTLPNISQNYLPKVNTSNIFANSLVYDDGSSVLINTTTASAYKLDVNGTGRFQGALSGTSATFSGQVDAASFYTSDTRYVSNQIQAGYNTNAEDVDLWVNYSGYQGGTTRFRDFRIGNGKNGQIAFFDGSTGAATFSSSVTAGGVIATSGTGLNSSVRIANTTATTGVDWHLYSLNNGNFGLYNNTASSYAFVATSGGSVGIGTTSPDYLFTIDGKTGDASTVTLSRFYASKGQSGAAYLQIQGTRHPTASVRRMILDAYDGGGASVNLILQQSGGNVGIGTTSPQSLLSLGAGVSAQKLLLYDNNNNFKYGFGIQVNELRQFFPSDAYMTFGTISTTDGTTFAERMRITSGGTVLVGTTSTTGVATGSSANPGVNIGPGASSFQVNNNSNIYLSKASGYTSNDFTAHFVNGTYVGGISTNGSSTTYATSSDYRLKTDLKDFVGIDIVKLLNVYDYQWVLNKSRSFGVLAHELQSVLPDAVTGVKDGEQMQGVDYSKLTPILVKAIQEQQAQIEEQKADIESLKALINK